MDKKKKKPAIRKSRLKKAQSGRGENVHVPCTSKTEIMHHGKSDKQL